MNDSYSFGKRLSDEFVIRRSTYADRDRIAEFNGKVWGNESCEYTKKVFDGISLESSPELYLYVEHVPTKDVAACVMLIPEILSYGGIEFDLLRPETVSTDPGYRNKGFLRELMRATEEFAALHEHKLISLGGVVGLYEQFDGALVRPNERGLVVAASSMPGYAKMAGKTRMPPDKPGADMLYNPHEESQMIDSVNQYSIHPCTREDFDLIHGIKTPVTDGYISIEYKEYHAIRLMDHFPDGTRTIKNNAGEIVGGFFYSNSKLEDGLLIVYKVILKPSVCCLDIRNLLLAFCLEEGRRLQKEGDCEFKGTAFLLNDNHSLYTALPVNLRRTNCMTDPLVVYENAGYPLYYKIIDFSGFFEKIRPLLETRIGQSPLAGYTGALHIYFYKYNDGIKLVWDNGRLISVENQKMRYGELNLTQKMMTRLLLGKDGIDKLHAENFQELVIIDMDMLILSRILFPPMKSRDYA